MSKLPFWSPPGQVSRKPPIIRFEGVRPGSPEAARLAKAFEPQIKQFYLGAARAYALGELPQSRAHRQFGDDLSMSYTNQYGQETVTVKARPEGGKPQRKKGPPDWWYIELNTPPGDGLKTFYAAFMRVPGWDGPLPELYRKGPQDGYQDGYARSSEGPFYYDNAHGEPLAFGFPDTGETPASTTIIDRGTANRQTLVLDVRPFHGFSVVMVDLYGYIRQDDTGNFAYSITRYRRNEDLYPLTNIVYDGGSYYAELDINGVVTASNAIPVGEHFVLWLGYDPTPVVSLVSVGAEGENAGGSTPFPDTFMSIPGPITFYQHSGFPTQPNEYLEFTGAGTWAKDDHYTGSAYEQHIWGNYIVSKTFTYTPWYRADIIAVPLETTIRTNILAGEIPWESRRWVHDQETGLQHPPEYTMDTSWLTFSAYTQNYFTWEPAFIEEGQALPTRRVASFGMPTWLFGDVALTAFTVYPMNQDPTIHFNLPFLGTMTLNMNEWADSWTPGPDVVTS